MIKFDVLNRWSGKVQFTAEIDCKESDSVSLKLGLSIKWALLYSADLRSADLRSADLRSADLRSANLYGADLRSANLRSANLYSADLRSANLRSADLSSANLYGADLRSANLYGADLSSADLRSANLRSADLRSANLRSANLYGADLSSADLSGANLYGADLRSANLSGANLSSADLSGVKDDFFKRLAFAKGEAVALYDYLARGKINGSVYSGECACFCGTVAKIRNENYECLTNGLKADANSPTEKFFTGIATGDTPENNPVSKIVAEWMREFMTAEKIKFPEYKLVSSFEFKEVFVAKKPKKKS